MAADLNRKLPYLLCEFHADHNQKQTKIHYISQICCTFINNEQNIGNFVSN
jgi:hypothetical protein